jgi:hypothetical protein
VSDTTTDTTTAKKKPFRKFIEAYAWFIAIAILLFLGATFCYRQSDENPRAFDQEVSSVLKKIQGVSDAEQRQIIAEEVLNQRNEYLGHQHFEHLGEALLLAGIMILTAEGITRYMASKEIWEDSNALSRQIQTQADQVSKNVWNAIFKRLVPNPVAAEVEKLLKTNICRVRPEYTVILSKSGYVDAPHGCVVIKRRLYYRLLNLRGEVYDHIIRISVDHSLPDTTLTTADGKRVTLPRICEFKVKGKDVTLTAAQRTSIEYKGDFG